jgi:transcriptional regulator with XRE-family HTH domain
MTVFERYIEARKTLKIKQGELAEAIDISQPALSQQDKLGNINIKGLIYISKTYKVNMNWLFRGEGEMLSELSNEVKDWIERHDLLQGVIDELTLDMDALLKERALLKAKVKALENKKIQDNKKAV